MTSIGVFGSSSPRPGSPEYEQARVVGRALARAKARLVCGGYGGLMEAACQGAADEGGTSLGIVLAGQGVPNAWLTEAVAVQGLGERLARLRDESEGWIFLPRGLGTMLELTWMAESVVKREAVARPFVLLGDFWRPTVDTVLREAAGSGAQALASWVRWAKTPGEAVEMALPTRRTMEEGRRT
ncbi:MAG TPA: LOG family protein [Thermoanaerobaculia bacterium]|nr:LOG family protein [Thermoanaerobaculia bacterium]